MTRLAWEFVGILAAILAAFVAFEGGKYVGAEDAKQEAKSKERDAIAKAVDDANKRAKKDQAAAIRAERARADARVAAAARSAGLQHSIRTELVYRDPDCVLPAADVVRINDAISAGRAKADAAGLGDGAVRAPDAASNGDDRGDRGQPVAGGGAVERMRVETRRAGELPEGE